MDIKRIGVIMALAWVIIRLALFNSSLEPNLAVNIAVGLNFLFLLIVIFLAVRAHHQTDSRSIFLDDVKQGMKQAVIYVLIIASFIYINYKWIDTDYLESRTEQRVEAEMQRIEHQGGWKAFAAEKSNGIPADKSEEEYLDNVKENGMMYLQPGFIFGLTLMAFISLGFIYTLILTALNRKVLKRFE